MQYFITYVYMRITDCELINHTIQKALIEHTLNAKRKNRK